MKLSVTFPPAAVEVSANSPAIELSTGAPVVRDYVERQPFEGEYAAVPSDKEQIIPTKGLRMTEDFVIAPIPPSYGRIGWNGSYLTVS